MKIIIIIVILLFVNNINAFPLESIEENGLIISNNNYNESLVQESITGLFNLWRLPCNQWINVFSNTACWYHPKFPDGINYNDLLPFCIKNQETEPALFRQDGQIRVTVSGINNNEYIELHALVPYVYGQLAGSNDPNSLFINSGWEYIELYQYYGNNTVLITKVVEFFNRIELPFTWPPNN
jgi:hypothetical protein